MARIKSNFPAIPSQHIVSDTPFDDRYQVEKRNDLINNNMWQENNTDVRYDGMIVAVIDDGDNNGLYSIKNRNKANYQSWDLTDADYYDPDGWYKLPEKNIKADWNANSGEAEILNKPDINKIQNDISAVQSSAETANTGVSNAQSRLNPLERFKTEAEKQIEKIQEGINGNVNVTRNINTTEAVKVIYVGNEYIWDATAKTGSPHNYVMTEDGIRRIDFYISTGTAYTDSTQNEIETTYVWKNCTSSIEIKIVKVKPGAKIIYKGNSINHRFGFLSKINVSNLNAQTNNIYNNKPIFAEKWLETLSEAEIDTPLLNVNSDAFKSIFDPDIYKMLDDEGETVNYFEVPNLGTYIDGDGNEHDETSILFYFEKKIPVGGVSVVSNLEYIESVNVKTDGLGKMFEKINELYDNYGGSSHVITNNDTRNPYESQINVACANANQLCYFKREYDEDTDVWSITGERDIVLDNNGYVIPPTEQHKFVVDVAKAFSFIKWIPKKDVPVGFSGTYANSTFEEGKTQYGIPYSGVFQCDKFIGVDVSIYTFMTAVNNPYSLFYTESVNSAHSLTAWGNKYLLNASISIGPYYGTMCSGLSALCGGQNTLWNTRMIKWACYEESELIKLHEQSDENLQIGDIILRSDLQNNPSHTLVVAAIHRDSITGLVDNIDCVEASSRLCNFVHSVPVTNQAIDRNNKPAFYCNLNVTQYKTEIYRPLSLYKNINTDTSFYDFIDPSNFDTYYSDISNNDKVNSSLGKTDLENDTQNSIVRQKEFTYNDDICTFAGDKATFAKGDLVVLNYNLGGSVSYSFDSIELKKVEYVITGPVGAKVWANNDQSVGSYDAAAIAEMDIPEYVQIMDSITGELENTETTTEMADHTVIIGNELEPGQYYAYVHKGESNDSDPTYFEVLDTDNNWKIKKKWSIISDDDTISGTTDVSFECEEGEPVSFAIVRENGSILCERTLSEQEKDEKHIVTDIFSVAKKQMRYDDLYEIISKKTDNLYIKIRFKGKYGRACGKQLLFNKDTKYSDIIYRS